MSILHSIGLIRFEIHSLIGANLFDFCLLRVQFVASLSNHFVKLSFPNRQKQKTKKCLHRWLTND